MTYNVFDGTLNLAELQLLEVCYTCSSKTFASFFYSMSPITMSC